MPWLRNTLAWATPVRVDLLGAHLETYVETLPTIITLRLCHRQGEGSAISKLPVEMLVLIEEHLIEAQRMEARKTWQAEYTCFRDDCEPKDHYPRSRLNDWRRMLRLDTARSDVLSADDIEERLNDFISDHTSYFDIHTDRRCSWEERTELQGMSFNPEYKDMFEKHFGLALWVSRTRVPERSWNEYTAEEATLAYITLPTGPAVARDFPLSPENRNKDWLVSTSSAMEIVTDVTLPGDAQARMQRCLRILGLEPHAPESEANSVLAPHATTLERMTKPCKTWPCLTILTETVAGTDD